MYENTNVVSDLENVFSGLSSCEKEMDDAEKDAEVYRISKTTPVYAKRRQLLTKIPKFWYVVLAQNEDFSDYLKGEDLKFLETIEDIYVEHLVKDNGEPSENPRDFSITFKFSELDAQTPGQEVTKYFETSVDDNGEEVLKSKPVQILWPAEYSKINPANVKDKTTKEGKHSYRQGMKSFFSWFRWTGSKPGKEFRQGEELARLIAEDLFPYAVKYYTEAMPGLGEDGEESSEELDLSEEDDDDEDDEDEDEEASTNGKRKHGDDDEPPKSKR